MQPILIRRWKFTRDQKRKFFPYECFNKLEKLNNKELPPYEAFYNILWKCNPFGIKYLAYEKVISSGLTTESALVKMRLWNIIDCCRELVLLAKVLEQE